MAIGDRLLLDSMPHIVWVTDAEGQLLYINQLGLERLGVTPDQVAGWGWLKFVHPDDIPRAREGWLLAVHDRREYWNEYRLRRPDGNFRWHLTQGAAIPNAAGMAARWVGTWTDIDDRHRAEVERDAVLQRLRLYIDRMPLGYVLFDAQMQIIDWNAAAEHMFGYRRDEVLGLGPPFEPLIPAPGLPDAERTLDRVRAGDMAAHSIFENLTKSGGRITCEWFNTPRFETSGAFAGLVSLVQDITARKRVEADLAASNDQLRERTEELRALSANVTSAREAEGIRIARELHDELGGSLSAIKWEIERLASSLARTGDPTPALAVRERLTAIANTVGETVLSVQRIASELRPSMLDDLGLVDAIEWHTQEFQRRTGITARCDCGGAPAAFAPAESTAIFRVFQEALTNVMRHARATKVEVGLQCDGSRFTLTVRDNGIGITLPSRRATGGLGILGMRERAALIGAELALTRIEPCGTELALHVPVGAAVATPDR